MTSPEDVPGASSHPDARNRAWRTFLQGLLLDIGVALAAALAVVVTDVRWTREYWLTLALLAGKTVVQTGMAYLMRRMIAVKTLPTVS